MNDFFGWIRDNKRVVITIVVFLVVFSAVVGFITGTIKRRSSASQTKIAEIEKIIESRTEFAEKGKHKLLMPNPVIPHITEPFPKFTFYLDSSDADVKDLRPLPVRISELLRYRDVGISTDIKPFQFHNEETDILTVKDELAEP